MCAVPMTFLMPLLSPVLIGLAVALWFSTYYAAFDFVRKRRKLIETEIPRFALTIGQNLENDRDVLKILTSYRRVAGRDFSAELDQTIADMKTGNYENALIRFETRIGSPMLSDVVRGLIGVLRGDDQRMYFKMICFDMRQIEQNNLKKEAAKRPRQIQRYSMMRTAGVHHDHLSGCPLYRGHEFPWRFLRVTVTNGNPVPLQRGSFT